jgi:hypothetical protein
VRTHEDDAAGQADQDAPAGNKAVRVTTKSTRAKKAQDEPLETVARKARGAFKKAVKAEEGGDTERGKSLILTAARCVLDCKIRVGAGEYGGTWDEFIAEHLEEIAEHVENMLSFVEPASRAQRVTRAAAQFLAWQEEHIQAPKHNHVVSTVYALASHFKGVVPVMPKLGYFATMNTSGKSTAGQMVVDVGNFAAIFRTVEQMSAAACIRVASETKQGVKLEDLHLLRADDDVFRFMKNSFPRDGKHVMADLKNQKKYIVYDIGGCPIVFTTNKVSKLNPDVRRRSILLPMIRQEPRSYSTIAERQAALQPIWKVFAEAAAEWGEAGEEGVPENAAQAVEARLKDALPNWMDEAQKDRWRPLYAVCRALLGEVWERRLEEAARHLEQATARASQEEVLLADIAAVRADNPDTIGIVPNTLYAKLQERNHDVWGELSYTKLGTLVRDIQDADGREPPKHNVPKGANVVGVVQWRKGDKYFPWSHFKAAWRAYGIAVDGLAEAA